MATLRGFPPSNTLSAGVRIAETDLSFIGAEQSFHRAGIVGFASKGPINVPTLIQTTRQLHTTFGYPHPEASDPYAIYAAEQYLLVASELWFVRVAEEDAVSDERAVVASIDIPVAGGAIAIKSDTAGPYVFDTDSFFKWKLNDVLASKTLVVDADSYTTTELAALLNSQLETTIDGIEFYVGSGDKIGVSTTFAFGPDSSLELASVSTAIYGPLNGSDSPGFGGVSGLGTGMTQAQSTSSNDGYGAGYSTPGEWDFSSSSNLQLLVVIDGTDNALIDNVVQVIDLEDLEGSVNTTEDLVNEINSQITAGTLVGGFYAVGGGVTDGPTIDSITLDLTSHPFQNADNLTLATLHHGQDARLLVKSDSTAFDIFDFDGLTAVGTSPSGVTGDSDVAEDAIVIGSTTSSTNSFTLTADSAGIEGNETQVIVTNDTREGVFRLEVFSNGATVESWGNLSKSESDSHYVSTYLALASNYIRAVDNTDTAAPPKNGTYQLAGGLDGIPSDPDQQDELLIGNDAGMSGMYSLSEPEQVDIDLIACPGHSSTAVILALINVCSNYRQDCLALIDPPFGLTVNEIIQWQNGVHPLNTTRLDSDFAALYWPWVKIYDTFNRLDVWVPPSGSIMAVYAHNDNLGQPWFAPAGINRGIVPGISDVFSRPTLAERNLMYGNRNAINPIITFSDLSGFVVWGQKTLQRTPTALDRVNVRRLMFTAEKRIASASRQLLFDPNDSEFQARFTQLATSILREIQVGRGLTGFIIQADSTLNTPDVIDRNEFRAKIGIQPTRAAEFIFIEFTVNRTGSLSDSTGGF